MWGAEAGEEGGIGWVKGETEIDEPKFADAGPGEDFPGHVTLSGRGVS